MSKQTIPNDNTKSILKALQKTANKDERDEIINSASERIQRVLKGNLDPVRELEIDIELEEIYSFQKRFNLKTLWCVNDVPMEKIFELHHLTIREIFYQGNEIWERIPQRIKFKFGEAPSTWLTLWKVIDQMVIDSGDLKHNYIEVFQHDGNDRYSIRCGN